MRTTVFLLSLLLSCSAVAAESFRQVLISEPGDIDVLQLVDTSPLPEPGPGEVRIRVIAARASFTDIMVRKGIYGGIDAELPYPPGYDLVGVVDKVGPGVSGIATGQRVADMTIWGAYTEYAIRPAENLVPLPDNLPAEEAVVLVLAYVTAYQMLFRVADVRPGQSVLIHGASGAVGTALAQLGRMAGLTMYGTASSAKQDYLKGLGVNPIDYQTEDFVERIREANDGAGVDMVFDAISVDNFARSYSVLTPGGILVEYGLYLKTRDEDSIVGLIGEFLSWQWQQLMWTWFPEQDRRFAFYSIADMRSEQPQWFKDDLASLFDLAVEGTVTPRIWKRLPLAEAAQAHRHIEAGDVEGKIVLTISADSKTVERR